MNTDGLFSPNGHRPLTTTTWHPYDWESKQEVTRLSQNTKEVHQPCSDPG